MSHKIKTTTTKNRCSSTCWPCKKGFLILALQGTLCLLALCRGTNATAQGLTAYGEPCTDPCKQRGFPYTWCHKKPSRNGTWIDRDYCSTGPGVTRYQEPCLGDCSRRDGAGFYACRTRETKRGDWDYCSPFRKVVNNWYFNSIIEKSFCVM